MASAAPPSRGYVLAVCGVFFIHFFSAFVRPYGKIAALRMPSEVFLAMRLLLASAILFTTSYARGFSLVAPRSAFRVIFVSAVFDICVSKWIFFLSLKTTSISTSAVISATLPAVVTYLMDLYTKGRGPSPVRQLLAITLACAGSALSIWISVGTDHKISRSSPIGVGLCIVSVLIGALVLVAKSNLPRSVNSEVIGAWESLIAGLVLMSVAMATGTTEGIDWVVVFSESDVCMALFLYASYQSITAPMIIWSVKITGAAFFTMAKTTLPIFSAVVAFFVLGEVLTVGQIGGMLMACCGLAMHMSS
eukprot:comp24345_c0_seq1/m.46424 comp24345_c0_seq1/g.46424  ORF comp24345_c0_seq1/g.46424 comp24345_c0_seq1/m.46424 type:complete len:306 (-) comp24345_c0_seq1:236-1153(-)